MSKTLPLSKHVLVNNCVHLVLMHTTVRYQNIMTSDCFSGEFVYTKIYCIILIKNCLISHTNKSSCSLKY